jgi:pimeloyl-ACP methyl ester carboxylesterase
VLRGAATGGKRAEAKTGMGGYGGRSGGARVPAGRFVELPGRGRTFVREAPGPVGAPTVVLLHGWSATAALNWWPSFGPLSGHFRVVALDHRGHGRGLRTGGPFRLEDCADDVATLLGELGVDRCVAAGYSMGGPIAQLLWRRHPEVVSGLVLCATSATFRETPREWVLSGLATGGSVVAASPPFGPVAAAAMSVLRGWRGAHRLRCGGAVVGHDWTRIVEAGREICRFDSRPWIGELSVPTAVVATMGDEVVPPRRQLALAEAIPDATLRRVAGRHAVCTTDPRRFVPALVDACAEVAGLAASRASFGAAA